MSETVVTSHQSGGKALWIPWIHILLWLCLFVIAVCCIKRRQRLLWRQLSFRTKEEICLLQQLLGRLPSEHYQMGDEDDDETASSHHRLALLLLGADEEELKRYQYDDQETNDVGPTAKLRLLDEEAELDVIDSKLEKLIAIKTEEITLIQQHLARFSNHHHVRDVLVFDPYGDKGIYTGQAHNDKPHKRGTMRYADGRVYVGEWYKGRWHGYGRGTFPNGDSYAGQYVYDQRHGKGTYRWHDGRVYNGRFENDKRHGFGSYSWPDGARYDGEFDDGLYQGKGTFRFADRSFYTGEWQDGMQHGQGTCSWRNGRVYTGEWYEGKAHGQGKEINPNGTIRHDGQWSHDEPTVIHGF